MSVKTNAMRLLESRQVAYRLYEYSPEIHSAIEAAQAMGVPLEQVYKTLVVLRQEKRARPLLVMVPGDCELDMRALAQATGDKKLRMATQKEAEALTGLQVGGIGALALLNKGFDIWLDGRAKAHECIFVNGGQRGVNLQVRVEDLIRLTGARLFT